MECRFFVGQKVVCVHAIESPSFGGDVHPAVGQVYTVRHVRTGGKTPALLLSELVNRVRPHGDGSICETAWYWYRFRPATDISIFHKLVEKARKTGRVTVKA